MTRKTRIIIIVAAVVVAAVVVAAVAMIGRAVVKFWRAYEDAQWRAYDPTGYAQAHGEQS